MIRVFDSCVVDAMEEPVCTLVLLVEEKGGEERRGDIDKIKYISENLKKISRPQNFEMWVGKLCALIHRVLFDWYIRSVDGFDSCIRFNRAMS